MDTQTTYYKSPNGGAFAYSEIVVTVDPAEGEDSAEATKIVVAQAGQKPTDDDKKITAKAHKRLITDHEKRVAKLIAKQEKTALDARQNLKKRIGELVKSEDFAEAINLLAEAI